MEMLLILILALLPPSSSACLYSIFIISSSSSFPSNCTRLEGRFRVDDSSDLADSQLVELFANVRELHGVVQIWNSRLTTANFLANVRRITGDAYDKTLSIMNNTLLTSINLTSLEYSDGKVEIQNNPLLDLKPNCPALHNAYFISRSISSNLMDCGCELKVPFTWPFGPLDFPDACVVVYGNLIIPNPSPQVETLYSKFTSVQKLYGYLDVQSNLETLGFLQNLEVIESGPDDEYTMKISGEFLGRLDLVHLQSVSSRNQKSKIAIRGATLCFDPELVRVLVNSQLAEVSLSIRFCELDYINNPSFYCTGTLSNVSARCTRYIGDLLYLNQDAFFMFTPVEEFKSYTKVPQSDVKKIQQFEYIFGSLQIQGSALTNISLPNLKEVYTLKEDRNAIVISYNYLLEHLDLPNLEMAFPNIDMENNVNLKARSDWCDILGNATRRGSLDMMGDETCWNLYNS